MIYMYFVLNFYMVLEHRRLKFEAGVEFVGGNNSNFQKDFLGATVE